MKKEKEFKTYLERKFTIDYNVKQHLSNVRYFNDWLKQNNMRDIIRTTTAIIMLYVEYLQNTGIMVGTINNRLNSLRKYYDCMIKLGYTSKNPAANIFIKGAIEKVVENPLSEKTLNEIYKKFVELMDNSHKSRYVGREAIKHSIERYKLMLSLIIYQGLDTGEVNRLKVIDVDLNNQTINIIGNRRRDTRVLKLESIQVIPFYQYIQSLPANQEKLFNIDAQQSSYRVLDFVKGIEPQVKNIEHIRQSRMIIWISTLKLREAQKIIGHKYVSSTERYAIQNTSELVDELNTLHLFK